jgi:hypothetical protein
VWRRLHRTQADPSRAIARSRRRGARDSPGESSEEFSGDSSEECSGESSGDEEEVEQALMAEAMLEGVDTSMWIHVGVGERCEAEHCRYRHPSTRVAVKRHWHATCLCLHGTAAGKRSRSEGMPLHVTSLQALRHHQRWHATCAARDEGVDTEMWRGVSCNDTCAVVGCSFIDPSTRRAIATHWHAMCGCLSQRASAVAAGVEVGLMFDTKSRVLAHTAKHAEVVTH